MSDEYLIDKARVRASFDRAAGSYDAAAILQREVRERMLERLELVKIAPRVILDAGCGTGHATVALGKRYADSDVISLDIAMGMLQQTLAHYPWIKRVLPMLGQKRPAALCADIEQLPLRDASVDLIWSNVAIQWCNDLDSAFAGMARVLRPEGLLMFSTFGPDTLKELRAASGGDHVHVSRFIDMHDIGDALVRAGFSDPVLDVERFVLTYDDVMAVMRDLKAIGANNAATGRARGLLGRGFLQRLTDAYEQFRHEGKLPATYEVVYGHAWKLQSKQAGLSTVTLHPRKPR
ncbi:malonyl-CoA O-methyltransferase [Methylobacillus rhizosphaerae]|uniref:Malonyl-[acyl-carrier protein] O-methyltransferase n=1 Tax=Methylobacillus rhizosphaerae TaxID=551994 RepID=A0A238Y2C0_9PROT|nr:malonyl-ACP O-methyltransferase BioC [Methylobacillus rhizosphaerae]SNR65277.1 malonyl-CoA O-methyltransferase [Methylobacillus rhizosphaerae]